MITPEKERLDKRHSASRLRTARVESVASPTYARDAGINDPALVHQRHFVLIYDGGMIDHGDNRH